MASRFLILSVRHIPPVAEALGLALLFGKSGPVQFNAEGIARQEPVGEVSDAAERRGTLLTTLDNQQFFFSDHEAYAAQELRHISAFEYIRAWLEDAA